MMARVSGRVWALQVLLGSLVGCQCDPNTIDPPGEGVLRVYVQIDTTDSDVQLSQFGMTVERVDVVIEDPLANIEIIHTVAEGSQSLVIPALAERVPQLVLSASVPVGVIQQVRFVEADAHIRLAEPGDTDFHVEPIKVPSGPQTGIKIVPDTTVLLEEGTVVSLLATVRLGHSLHYAPGQGWMFKPVVGASTLTRPGIHDYLEPDDVLVNLTTTSFPELAVRVERAKVLNSSSLLSRDIVLDAATGQQVSFGDLRAANEASWRANRGSLLYAARDRLGAMAETALVEAELWVRVPFLQPFASSAASPEEQDLEHSAYVAQVRAANQPSVAAVEADVRTAGAEILAVELDPPRVFVRAPRSLIEALAMHPGVDMVALTIEKPVIHDRVPVELAEQPLFFAHVLGSGRGLRVAIVEPQVCVRRDHRDLRFMTFEGPSPCGDIPGVLLPLPDDHSTAVAGAIGGVHGQLGFIGLFAGRLLESSRGTISDSLLAQNPHLISVSVQTSANDRRVFDYAVYVHRRFVQNGSGNVGDPMVELARCFAYNSLCVGGYNTGPAGADTPGLYFDDTHASGAFWRNDLATGREEPDLAGQYSQRLPDSLNLPDAHKLWFGTSFAGPSVVGLAGLIIANAPSAVLNDPTLLRTVLLASALRPVKDSADDNLVVPRFEDGIDDKTGAGVPRGDLALDILRDGHFLSRRLERNTDFDVSGRFVTPLGFLATPGQTVRVAIAWDQCDDNIVSVPDALLVDLDLTVAGPVNGRGDRQLKINASLVDNYEVFQFVALEGGSHQIRVQATRWDPCPVDGTLATNVAVAWFVGSP